MSHDVDTLKQQLEQAKSNWYRYSDLYTEAQQEIDALKKELETERTKFLNRISNNYISIVQYTDDVRRYSLGNVLGVLLAIFVTSFFMKATIPFDSWELVVPYVVFLGVYFANHIMRGAMNPRRVPHPWRSFWIIFALIPVVYTVISLTTRPIL